MGNQRVLEAIGCATLALLTLGAKCPRPPLDRPDGGRNHHDGGPGGAAGGDAGDASAGNDAGDAGDARDASDAGDARGEGGRPACTTPSSLDVWSTERQLGPIRGLFAIAPNDVWVSMDKAVQRWDGANWTAIPVNIALGESLGPVWASGPKDVWLSGRPVQRWNGSTWTDAGVPLAVTSGGSPSIIGRSADDVWVWENNQVAHWDGSSWADRSPPHDAPTGYITVWALWPAGADDVWLAGTGQAGPALERWNGAQWVLSPVPANVAGFTGMWGSSPTDIWLLGTRGMLHYDGSQWTVADATLQGLGGVWGSCASDVWALLRPIVPINVPRLAHFDGTTWSKLALTGEAPSFISGTGPDDVWMAPFLYTTVFHRHPAEAASVCGNSRLDPGEQCDPPDNGTCTTACQRVSGCGDGVLDPGELCDPPDGLTCDWRCQPIPNCGNGFIDVGEDCDPPGQPSSGPWCDSTCHRPRCGNGVIDSGESCDPPALYGWQRGQGTPYYCGMDCTVHDACAECHQICDSDPAGFRTCATQSCRPGLSGLCP